MDKERVKARRLPGAQAEFQARADGGDGVHRLEGWRAPFA